MSSPNPAERFAAALLIPGLLAKRLRVLDDRQIAELLDDEVGAGLNLLAPESTICLAAADRLRRRVIWSPGRKRFGVWRRERRSWAAIRDEGEHIMHAEAALYRARIPHLLLPFQKNKFASNVFMVPCAAEARDCLFHAGFRETPRSPSLLIDGATNRPIRVVESRT